MYRRSVSMSLASFGIATALLFMNYSAASAEDASPTINDYLADREIADSNAMNSSSFVVVDANGAVIAEVKNPNTSIKNARVAAVASGCSYRMSSYVTTTWVESVDGCGIVGFDSTARWTYAWTQPEGLWNAGSACTQGRGYYTSTTVPRWYGAGCGTSGGVTVQIGNLITVAKMRGYTVTPGRIGYTAWR